MNYKLFAENRSVLILQEKSRWSATQAWAWATGLGIYGGSLAGYLVQHFLQKREIFGSPWPALVALTVSAFLAKWFYPGRKVYAGVAAPALMAISVLAATLLRDSSGDSLGGYAETVYWLTRSDQPPPLQVEKAEFFGAITKIRGSLLLGAIFSNLTGSFESAKWTAFGWCLAGGLMLGACPVLPVEGVFLRRAIPLLAIFQPVLLYQGATLYQDAQLAGALTGVFASFLTLCFRPKLQNFIGLLLSLACLAISKTFALGYLILFIPIFLTGFLLRNKPKPGSMLIFALFPCAYLLPFTLPALRELRSEFPTKAPVISNYSTKILLFADPLAIDGNKTDGIHGGCGEVVPNSAVMFWRRHFAASKRGDDLNRIKPPFWFTRPELDVFTDLTPDLRFGGYGPLYGTAVLLALVPALCLLGSRAVSQTGWKWILIACLVMIPISPSWWARWFPQGWWIPFAACVGFLCGPPDGLKKFRWVGWLAKGGLLALGLNSFLILVFTVKGYAEAESVIARQLVFLKTLPSPLKIEPGHFAAARFWLDREKILYERGKLSQESATMLLYRTSLEVEIPDRDLNRIRQSPEFLSMLRKHRLLHDPTKAEGRP